jgi:hypothetical protein
LTGHCGSRPWTSQLGGCLSFQSGRRKTEVCTITAVHCERDVRTDSAFLGHRDLVADRVGGDDDERAATLVGPIPQGEGEAAGVEGQADYPAHRRTDDGSKGSSQPRRVSTILLIRSCESPTPSDERLTPENSSARALGLATH